MSISTTVRKAGPYAGDGTTTIFPFGFKVFVASDVAVYATDATGYQALLTTGYTVALNTNQDTSPGGTVTLLAAPATGTLLTIGSQVASTQPMVLTNNGGFFPRVLNDSADRDVILIQQLQELLSRAVTVPISSNEPAGGLVLPSATARANKFLKFAADGSVNVGVGTIDPNAISDNLSLQAMTGLAPSQIAVLFNINPLKYYGYIGDGLSHPLSSISLCQGFITSGWSLARWQTLFPRATSLSEQIDRHAIQRMCDLSPNGCNVRIPAGTGQIDVGIITGGTQNIRLTGEQRDLSILLFSQTGGTLWTHGNSTTMASGSWHVENIKLQTNTQAACCFNVWFNGTQTYGHTMTNVMMQPVTAGQYFQNACITRNINRGLQWRYVTTYGSYGSILTTDAFVFYCNTNNTNGGDTWDFYDCMTVGYRYGVTYDCTGYTSSTAHAFEEAQFINFQSYAGRGMFQLLNTNTNIAPVDNWTFITCGWQGTGPCFNVARVEFFRVRDCLLVNDPTTNSTIFGVLSGVSNGTFEGNEFWAVNAADTGLTGFQITDNASSKTGFNLKFRNNNVIAYATFAQFFLIDAVCQAGAFDERGTSFRGTATYTNGKVVDNTNVQVSQTRAEEEAAANTSGSARNSYTINIMTNGDIEYIADMTWVTSDSSGNALLNLPGNLFRSVKFADAANLDASKTTMPFNANPPSTSGVIIRIASNGTSPATGTSVRGSIRVVGN